MQTKTQHGYLVIADISGYTSFVATTELEHAHEILSELLELVVNQFTPILTISRLQGDAVIAYVPEEKLPRGEMLVDLVEAAYTAFRDRIKAVRRRTMCECRACAAIPSLDLKFFTHHGDYIIQSIAGVSEMVGSDVNLAHRLTKNHVTEATGWRGYALFTAKSLERLGVQPEDMHKQIESYEHLEDVVTYTIDLNSRYKELAEARRVFITPEESDVTISEVIPAPPAVVWDWLNDPHKRVLWEGFEIRPDIKPGGRSGVGTRNHCVHGKSYDIQTILDWRPFDYYTLDSVETKGSDHVVWTHHLVSVEGGTRLSYYMRVTAPWLKKSMFKVFVKKMMKPTLNKLAHIISSEAEPSHAHQHPALPANSQV